MIPFFWMPLPADGVSAEHHFERGFSDYWKGPKPFLEGSYWGRRSWCNITIKTVIKNQEEKPKEEIKVDGQTLFKNIKNDILELRGWW